MNCFFSVNEHNRDLIEQKYIDAIVGHMDFITAKRLLRDYITDEKRNYSDDDLKDEILARCSDIRNEVIAESYPTWEEYSWLLE